MPVWLRALPGRINFVIETKTGIAAGLRLDFISLFR